MSVQVVSNLKAIPAKVGLNESSLNNQLNNQLNNAINVEPDIKSFEEQKKASTKVKAGVLLTTLASVGIATAIALKLKGKLVNPFKTPIKKWGLFSVEYKENDIPMLVAGLGASSIAGGLVGGAIFDKKENMKAKYREAIIQSIGNIATPLVCVAGGMKLFKKYLNSGIVKTFALKGKFTKEVPAIFASAAFLGTGIIAGNQIGNFINKHIFKVDDKRKLKLTDMSPHIDDICLALSIVAANSSKIISRIIPAALLVSGFSTGIAQENSKNLHTQDNKKPVN